MYLLDAQLDALRPYAAGAAGERLFAEFSYARRISILENGAFDALLGAVMEEALSQVRSEKAITLSLVQQCEEKLMPMQKACKRYTWMFVGHAHIDMNWLWPWEETVSIVINTFRTMLTLMREYPDFTYAQSQASTYAIVEEYAPDLLPAIRDAIRRGQWEVVADAWVEADHNMPSLASDFKHLLYTKRYLSRLLDLPVEKMDINFMPDTFGHHQGLPDILTQGGTKYMYHCRGEENETLYRWRGETGREVLVYRDARWYNSDVRPLMADQVAAFCGHYQLPVLLQVYGVGDHGGGPTRDQLDMIRQMQSWPIFPTLAHGSYHRFFEICEEKRNTLSVKEGELNCVFTGCYTTQTRIKRGNSLSERALRRSELYAAMASAHAAAPYPAQKLEHAWRKVLFNQFHDILPGSGKPETREYAMGEYQKVYATARAEKELALSALCTNIDTSVFKPFDPCPNEEQTPPYFSVDQFQAAVIKRRDGLRLYHVFNPLAAEQEVPVEIGVWQLSFPDEEAEFIDEKGQVLPSQLIFKPESWYGAVLCARHLVWLKVPACGYTTVGLRRKAPAAPTPFGKVTFDPRSETSFSMVLENEYIRAEFDTMTGRVRTITDKETGKVTLQNAGFDFIEEDGTCGMTAWRIGRYMNVQPAGSRAAIHAGVWGELRKAYEVKVPFGERSMLEYTVSLDKGSRRLHYQVKCDWREFGVTDRILPNLSFSAKLPAPSASFTYRIGGSVIARPSDAQDKPALYGMEAQGQALLCDCRYGFRGDGDTMSVTLIHGSTDPDKIPEMGEIECALSLGAIGDAAFPAVCDAFLLPPEAVDTVYGVCHPGTLPATASLLSLSGAGVSLFGVKHSEDGSALILYLANETGAPVETALTFALPIADACFADVLERPADAPCTVRENTVQFSLPAHEKQGLRITLAK